MKSLLALMLLAGLAPNYAASTTMLFDVYLDDKRIGKHQVRISSENNEKYVEVKANMQVNLLFITLFRYEHEAYERWQQGCVAKLDTRTLDDGENLAVTGRKIKDGFEVISSAETQLLSDCVRTFAYWDPQLLSSNYLLNTQNGKYEPAELVNEGESSLSFNGANYGEQRYRLNVGDSVVIRLWYDADNNWQALETDVAGGRKLRYLRQENG